MTRFAVHHGDCLEVIPTLPEASVDSIVTDPPYGLSFMGKDWDHGVPGEPFWREALRVAKPGAFLLAFGGTRTFHRMACAIEDAGWQIRDCIMWVYGSGFPKSLDVSKAIDKAAGADREVIGQNPNFRPNAVGTPAAVFEYGGAGALSLPATDAARQWSGWGTALKPAWEPIIVARKPLVGTVADNVLRHGTGALNVDGCRVGDDGVCAGGGAGAGAGAGARVYGDGLNGSFARPVQGLGRWPANLIHDGSDEVVGLFPHDARSGSRRGEYANGAFSSGSVSVEIDGSVGSASRFFYCAKASKADRDEGCDMIPARRLGAGCYGNGLGAAPKINGEKASPIRNVHPTVKPTDLMRYLCRLVTQPGGTVLDPFTGSGSTGKAAVLEGFNFIGIEREEEYVRIAEARIRAAMLPLEQAMESVA